MAASSTHRAGRVAIVGRPNVGKSTLMNRLVGEKLAIVSPKPQTTRNRIAGVWSAPDAQIVFVDTPGVHAGRSGLNRFMAAEATAALEDVDALLLVVEPAAGAPPAAVPGPLEGERRILDRLREIDRPVVLAVNKVDTVPRKSALLPLIEAWRRRGSFAAIVPVCATRGDGVEALLGELRGLLPAGPPLFDPGTLTDRSERFLASELIREQIFLRLRQELPYSIAVVVRGWQERPERGDVVIAASILVERDSQRGIVLGKGGSMIREVGRRAREEIGRLLGRPAHLRLEVEVAPGWTGSPDALARAGYGGAPP